MKTTNRSIDIMTKPKCEIDGWEYEYHVDQAYNYGDIKRKYEYHDKV